MTKIEEHNPFPRQFSHQKLGIEARKPAAELVQFAPKLCLALVVFDNFDINVHGFHNIQRKSL